MKQLTEEQRYNISAYLQSGKSRTEIANLVGVHRSTISRELRRNSDKRNGIYKPDLAQAKYMSLISASECNQSITNDFFSEFIIFTLGFGETKVPKVHSFA